MMLLASSRWRRSRSIVAVQPQAIAARDHHQFGADRPATIPNTCQPSLAARRYAAIPATMVTRPTAPRTYAIALTVLSHPQLRC